MRAGRRANPGASRCSATAVKPEPESTTYTIDTLMERPPFELMWMERQASFFITGGLVAVHATERSREAIWEAMQSRNVYGTSGDRILFGSTEERA